MEMLEVTEALSVSASARYNIADIALRDRLGTSLNGKHDYVRLNPAMGLSYRIVPPLTVYLGYSQANRAPTPAELSCAAPSAPCSLTNFFVGDPELKQVVVHTIEAGFRGQMADLAGGDLRWQVGFYRAGADDDIQFVSSPVLGRAFFQNVGRTRRQGIETSLEFRRKALSLSLDYSYTQATFRSPLTLNSPLNPLADSNGQIDVVPGDRLASIPANTFKAILSYELLPGWTLAVALHGSSGFYLHGDESNLNPKTPSYAVFDLGSSYRLTDRLEVFASLKNLFDENYATFGTFSPTADVPIAEAPGANNPRSLSPAAPFAAFGGFRFTL
jgi:outer membrane receptor protein involved in Fe transport